MPTCSKRGFSPLNNPATPPALSLMPNADHTLSSDESFFKFADSLLNIVNRVSPGCDANVERNAETNDAATVTPKRYDSRSVIPDSRQKKKRSNEGDTSFHIVMPLLFTF